MFMRWQVLQKKMNFVFLYIFRYEAEMDEKEMLSKIHHCTSTVAKASVENTAFLHPLGVEKGLNVGKYRDEVEKELKGGTKKGIYLFIF